MFSQVSVCPRGGVCPIACLNTQPPGQIPPRAESPWADTPGQTPPGQNPLWAEPPLGRTPSGQTPPPLGRHPAQADTTPGKTLPLGRHPPAQCMLGYDQQADGAHPTGMHSCFIAIIVLKNRLVC